jgi:hypothetical protein
MTLKFGVAVVLTVTVGAARAADQVAPPRRARPPVWTPDVLDVFFEDARDHLVGERPTASSGDAVASTPGPPRQPPPAVQRSVAWSQLIDGETLAGEVKRIVAGLRDPLANPGKFKAGGYQQCRADFSLLAVLFGVIAEYDGDVRWRENAAPVRDALARAGESCKTATDQSFAEAAARKTDLDDLVRGERPSGAGAELARWSDLAERPVLMQRMEQLLEEQISPAMANAREFSRRADDVRQEAELLALLAEVIQREEYEYWDDEGFKELAHELRSAATDLKRAAVEAEYEAARAAAARAGQACSQCHEGWRG